MKRNLILALLAACCSPFIPAGFAQSEGQAKIDTLHARLDRYRIKKAASHRSDPDPLDSTEVQILNGLCWAFVMTGDYGKA